MSLHSTALSKDNLMKAFFQLRLFFFQKKLASVNLTKKQNKQNQSEDLFLLKHKHSNTSLTNYSLSFLPSKYYLTFKSPTFSKNCNA